MYSRQMRAWAGLQAHLEAGLFERRDHRGDPPELTVGKDVAVDERRRRGLEPLLGGGLARSDVFGKWKALSASTLDDGDVPGVNNPFDVFGEIVQKRLHAGSLAAVFPDTSSLRSVGPSRPDRRSAVSLIATPQRRWLRGRQE